MVSGLSKEITQQQQYAKKQEEDKRKLEAYISKMSSDLEQLRCKVADLKKHSERAAAHNNAREFIFQIYLFLSYLSLL